MKFQSLRLELACSGDGMIFGYEFSTSHFVFALNIKQFHLKRFELEELKECSYGRKSIAD